MIRSSLIKYVAAGPALIALILAAGCQTKPAGTAASGTVIISSEPSAGAEIKIDGRPTGQKTDAAVRLKSGTHLIEISKPNAAHPDFPEVGQAQVNVAGGTTTRVTVRLGVMAIMPAASKLSTVIETEGQKSIIKYFHAINVRDYRTAYSYLNRKTRSAHAPTYNLFVRSANQLSEVKVLGMRKQAGYATDSTETVEALLKITRRATPRSTLPLLEKITVFVTTLPDESGIRKLGAVSTADERPLSPFLAPPRR